MDCAEPTPRFAISHWACWPPDFPADIDTRAALPALPQMPPMQRRRLDRLGRIALDVAWRSAADLPALPFVFASRWGDIRKSLELIAQLREGALSPMTFSLSVHNAIGAQFSIARGDKSPYTAISAGDATVEAAFVEALGQLVDGADGVTVICYGEPMPPPYDRFDPAPCPAHAWACRLSLVRGAGCSLQPVPASPVPDAVDVDDPGLVAFLQSGKGERIRSTTSGRWLWRFHA